MNILRYHEDGQVRVGIRQDGTVTDLAGVTVLELLREDRATRDRRIEDAAAAGRGGRPVEGLRLAAPVERPPKYLCMGFNYADHVDEEPDGTRADVMAIYEKVALTRKAFADPRLPTLFNKQTNCITGPFDPVWLPRDSSMLDWEGELAVVIGRGGRRVGPEEAQEMIAGYTVANDVSVRDWQWDGANMWPGKSFDTHGPLGPHVVTADALDASDLAIRTWVNGELKQQSRTSAMVRTPAEIVSIISQLCSLEPGDVIATGTPAGIGTPTGAFLEAGDVMRVEVEGIGAIENTVVPEPVA